MAGIISFIFGAIELIVGLRFLFLILGANPLAPFVSWIYDVSSPFVAPFYGILGNGTTTSTSLVHSGAVVHSIFEPASLIALLVYAAIGGVLLRIFMPSRSA